MNLCVVGLSHHTAPVEVRERVAFGPSEILSLLAQTRTEQGMDEAVLLSTCNRTELYLHDTGADDLAGVRTLLANRAGPMPRPLDAYLYELRGVEAARHLLRVASGLDAGFNDEFRRDVSGGADVAFVTSRPLPVLMRSSLSFCMASSREIAWCSARRLRTGFFSFRCRP